MRYLISFMHNFQLNYYIKIQVLSKTGVMQKNGLFCYQFKNIFAIFVELKTKSYG